MTTKTSDARETLRINPSPDVGSVTYRSVTAER